MNLADTKREFQTIVARYRDGVPLDAPTRAQAMNELTDAYRNAMRQIDEFMAHHHGQRRPFRPINTRTGLITKLNALHTTATTQLGLP